MDPTTVQLEDQLLDAKWIAGVKNLRLVRAILRARTNTYLQREYGGSLMSKRNPTSEARIATLLQYAKRSHPEFGFDFLVERICAEVVRPPIEPVRSQALSKPECEVVSQLARLAYHLNIELAGARNLGTELYRYCGLAKFATPSDTPQLKSRSLAQEMSALAEIAQQAGLEDAARFLNEPSGEPGWLDCQLEGNDTLLRLFIRAKQSDAVRWLLEHGADPNYPNARGITPFMSACWNCADEIGEILLDAGANVFQTEPEDGTPGWLFAAMIPKLLSRILREHPNIDLRTANNKGMTALMQLSVLPQRLKATRATERRMYQAAELLLNSGAEVNAVNAEGRTALMHVAGFGVWSVAELLVRHGADLEITDNQGRSPITYAQQGIQRFAFVPNEECYQIDRNELVASLFRCRNSGRSSSRLTKMRNPKE